MQKTATVYDVAAHAGVSIATVSRVFRRPDDVRASTRERVIDSVRALGYVPSGSARGLAARRTGVLGLFFPGFDAVEEVGDTEFTQPARADVVVDIPDSGTGRPRILYFDEVLRGSELEAWRNGFALMVAVGRGTNPSGMVSDIAGRVDGLALLAQSVPDHVLRGILDEGGGKAVRPLKMARWQQFRLARVTPAPGSAWRGRDSKDLRLNPGHPRCRAVCIAGCLGSR